MITPEELETKLTELENRAGLLAETIEKGKERQEKQETRVENFWVEIGKAEEKLDTVFPIVNDTEAKVNSLLESHNLELPRLESLVDRTNAIETFFNDFFTRTEGAASKSKHELTVDSHKEMTDLLKSIAAERKEIADFKIFIEGDGTATNPGFKKQIQSWQEQSVNEGSALYDDHKESFETMYSKIEGLVEGATTIGLAKSFKEQKEKYFWGNIIFSIILFATVIFMLVYSVIHYDSDMEWDDVGKLLASYLPVYGAGIWLATIAGRKLNQHVRLRQEYAYKETLAMAYEGHLREIKRLPQDENREALLRNHLEIMIYASAFNPSSTLDDKSHNEKQPFFVELLNKIVPSYFKQEG